MFVLQNDIKAHSQYKDALYKDRRSMNQTVTVEELKESVRQLRDRHIDRFHRSRNFPRAASSRKKRGAIFDQNALNRW